MVGRKVDDDFDPVLMSRRDQIIEIRPGVARVTEVFFDALEVAALVAVIRSGRIALAIGNVRVEIINRRRDPDRGHAQAGQIRDLLLDPGEVATPVETPIRFRRIVKTRALRWIVVRGATVKEAVGHNLIDDFAFEVGSASVAEKRERKEDREYREITDKSSHDNLRKKGT